MDFVNDSFKQLSIGVYACAF